MVRENEIRKAEIAVEMPPATDAITRLRRRDRPEQGAIRLEIEKRRPVYAIQARDSDDCAVD
jgi:hypothetical protein